MVDNNIMVLHHKQVMDNITIAVVGMHLHHSMVVWDQAHNNTYHLRHNKDTIHQIMPPYLIFQEIWEVNMIHRDRMMQINHFRKEIQ